MGGLSKGHGSFSDANTLRFFGKPSLENNGGFSSIRTKDLNLGLQDYKGLAMRVKGDGRTYQLRLNTDSKFRLWNVKAKQTFAA